MMMDEARIREFIRDELSKAQVIFTIKEAEGETKELIARLAFSKKLNQSNVPF